MNELSRSYMTCIPELTPLRKHYAAGHLSPVIPTAPFTLRHRFGILSKFEFHPV